MMANVRILLATYNGSNYIGEMIDSIIRQDYPDWQLVLSDDCSTDGTQDILEKYATEMPDRIIHYKSGVRFGNAQNHFMHLLNEFQDNPYIMFCDQDDVWHSDKIRKTLNKMREIEMDPNIPAMVHTDLRVVDSDLREIHSSFMQFSAIQGDRLSLKQLLVQNVVTGCTMMINHKLARLAVTKLPESGMLMHDSWIALLASACGTTGFVNEATIDYRQHGKNSVGAKNVRSLSHIYSRLKDNQMQASMRSTFTQAKVFEECFSSVLPNDMHKIVLIYAGLAEKNTISRKWSYFKYGFWKNGFLRRVGQLIGG